MLLLNNILTGLRASTIHNTYLSFQIFTCKDMQHRDITQKDSLQSISNCIRSEDVQIKKLVNNENKEQLENGRQLCLFCTFKHSRKSRNGKNARF